MPPAATLLPMNTPFNNVGRGPGSRLPPHLQPPHAQASQLQQLDAATAAAADYGPSRLAPSYQAPTPQPSWEQANAAAVQSFGQPMMPTIGMGGYDPNVVGVPQQQGIMNRSSPPQVAPGNGRYYSHEHTNSNGSVTAAFPPVEMPYIGMGPSMSWGAAMSDNEGSMPGRAGGGGGGRRDDKRPNGHTTQPPDVDSRPGTAGNMLDVAAQSGQLRGLNKTSPEDDDGEDKVDHRKRKRNRTIRSCVPCHNHKRKCDRKRPCGRCTALGLTGSCVYEVDEQRDPNDPEVIETDRLRRRIAELEQVVRELRQRHPPRNATAAAAAAAATNSHQSSPAPSLGDATRRAVVERYTRFKKGDTGNQPVSETSPTGSSASGRRDHYAEPYSAHALAGEEMVSDNTGRQAFLGAPAGKPMFRRLREILAGRGNPSVNTDELMNMPEDTAFKGWFGSTRNTFPFTTIWSHENFIDEIVGLLPTSEEAELLLTAFLDEIAVLFKAWHLPTLIEDYRAFFALPTSEKRTQPLANLSLFVMVCSLGSMVRASIGEIFGHSGNSAATSPVVNMSAHNGKDHTSSRLQSELYLSAAFQALRLCSFLANPTIATIQSQILVNIYLIHSERAADAWSLTGSLVRQCIAIGLHVDPTTWDSRISLREAEVRRRVWWSVVGLDCLLCVSYGRPAVTNYWTCQLPMDRPDDMLSDEPGSALANGPTTNALASEVTDETFHAAYFQLTLPSLDLLNRVFHVDPRVARESFMGWFPASTQNQDLLPMAATSNTYEDAIRLGRDIFEWYSHVPRGMRFEPDDNPDEYIHSRSRAQINQTLALAVKTFMLVLILHRPYLRADPSEYPESADLCYRAAHIILNAYAVMSRTKSSIVWSWWTMSYRAFHAGTVCAFLVVRDPGTEVAEHCLQDLRNAVQIFEGRKSNWNVMHPVQGDLCAGLAQLEKLATAATQQHRTSPLQQRTSPHNGQLSDRTHPSPMPIFPGFAVDPSVPTFPPPMSQVPSDGVEGLGLATDGGLSAEVPTRQAPPRRRTSELPFLQPWQMSTADPNLNTPFGMSNATNQAAPEPLSQIWASMFSVKMDPDGSINNTPIQTAQV